MPIAWTFASKASMVWPGLLLSVSKTHERTAALAVTIEADVF
jgi:hypothetical protein